MADFLPVDQVVGLPLKSHNPWGRPSTIVTGNGTPVMRTQNLNLKDTSTVSWHGFTGALKLTGNYFVLLGIRISQSARIELISEPGEKLGEMPGLPMPQMALVGEKTYHVKPFFLAYNVHAWKVRDDLGTIMTCTSESATSSLIVARYVPHASELLAMLWTLDMTMSRWSKMG